MSRKLRTSEVIHRFDESLSFYNRNHDTSYAFTHDDTHIVITRAPSDGVDVVAKLEFEAVFNAMHLSLRSRNKFVRDAITP